MTSKPLTLCSEAHGQDRQSGPVAGLAKPFPALWVRVLWGILALAVSAPGVSAPTPIQTHFDDDQVLAILPDQPPVTTSFTDPDTLADRVQELLTTARATGDPRFLGYAQNLLDQQPPHRLDARLRVLRATLWQSLHRFDAARMDLEQVLNNRTDRQQRRQALLTLANLDIVQGRYNAAEASCQQLQNLNPGLVATSCKAQVAARTGQATAAYRSLGAEAQQSGSGAVSRAWAEGTLADIAAQLGRSEAEAHWRRVLELTPDDLYGRIQLADWLVQQGRFQAAIALTEGYQAVDSLAVLRAIALQAADAPDAEVLVQSLQERFEEARWRGNLLHQRDYARFLLDVMDQPQQALIQARNNWQDQREPMDTRLLLRAAQASADSETLASVRTWLATHHQQDARYPETRP